MVKTLTTLAVAGLAGVVAFKLVVWVLVPLLAALLGILITALKIALVVALLYLAYRFFRRAEGDEKSAAA